MIDFSTLQGLTIPEGVVTQIADAAGNVLWALNTDFDGTFKVEKITATTYAGETSYSNEEFILLDIYPKTASSTVNVTYGGLTKTLTFSGTNARQVYFGTFNGVSDDVETPQSGILTIEGDWSAAGIGTYQNTSKSSSSGYCACITAVGNMDGSEKIPANAFRNCKKLKNVVIPYGVTEIADNAFYSCTNLTDVTIPESVTRLQSNALISNGSAFYGCKSLKSVTIPHGVTSIPQSTFNGCTSLTDVLIPDGVTHIQAHAFSGCKNLKSVIIPGSVEIISVNPWMGCFENNAISVDNGNAFFKIDGNCLIKIEGNVLISGFADAAIPTYIEELYEYSFARCTGLTSVTIPSSVTKIGMYSFADCTGLTSVTILNGVVVIDGYAFNGCTGLASIIIPSSVTHIQAHAFSSCRNLTSVEFSNPSGWYVTKTSGGDASTGTTVDVSDPANNATLLTDTYNDYYWYRS